MFSFIGRWKSLSMVTPLTLKAAKPGGGVMAQIKSADAAALIASIQKDLPISKPQAHSLISG